MKTNHITSSELRKNGWKKGNDWSWYLKLDQGRDTALIYKPTDRCVYLSNVYLNKLRLIDSIHQLNLIVYALNN